MRNVERVRLSNWRAVLPALRRAKIMSRTDGRQLHVPAENAIQLKPSFISETG